MALASFEILCQDENGNVLAGASVEFRREEDNTLATIYSDREGSTPTDNPMLADASGIVTGFAVGAAYKVTATSGAYEHVRRYYPIGTAQELDVTQLLALASTGALVIEGAYDGGEVYQLYDVVLDQGSSWIYTHPDPSSGNAPPTLPTTSNDYWQLIALAGEAGQGLDFDAAGLLADRGDFDGEAEGFTYLATDTGDLYVMGDGGSGDWSVAIPIEGPQGEPGASPHFKLEFSSSTTDSDPGAGIFRLNNATLSSVTFIYVDDLAESGANIEAWLQAFAEDDELHFVHVEDPTIEARYRVTAAPTNASGYTKIPVAHIASAGAFVGGDTFALGASLVGPEGTVDTADFLQPDVSNTISVGYPVTPYSHGTLAGGAVTFTPDIALGQKQSVALAASTVMTLAVPSNDGDFVLQINAPGTSSGYGLTISASYKVLPGSTTFQSGSTGVSRIYRAYIEKWSSISTIMLVQISP